MKLTWWLLALGWAAGFSCLALAQNVVLYRETFSYDGLSGAFPVSTVGWANGIPDNPNRLYQISGGDGAVFAFESAPATTVFYTSATLTQCIGAAFPSINSALYRDLTFLVDIQPYLTPANVTARFAVQMNNGSWYVASNPLPVPTTPGPFATVSNVFNPAGSRWNSLSVSGSGAIIGGGVSGNLAGNITGAGLVFMHAGNGGTFNFDNFVVEAADAGDLAANAASNGIVQLSWPAAMNVRLQTASEINGTWNNLPDSGTNAAATTTTNASTFFRLSTFSIGGLQDGDFESGNLSNCWQNAGSIASAALLSSGAFSGTYFLEQSNAVPYQVQTFQLVTNLPDGYYKLTAMVKNSGGQTACYLGGNDRLTSLPVSAQWTNTIVRGICVTNGQCLVAIDSDDPVGGNWCQVDFLQLIKDDISYNFLKGGDISELSYVEQGGGTFFETNGVREDCLQILKNHGWNFVRLRLYNDPGNTNWYPSDLLPSGVQNPTNILALASRAKAAGFEIELTLTFSDYWGDGQTQYKPHGWENLSPAGLNNAVYAFTTNFLTQMINQGTPPDYVSLGNEVDAGILLQNSTPAGAPIDTTNAPVNGSSSNFAYLSQLLNSGYAAVKAVSPSTQVIIHSSHVDAAGVQWFFNQCLSNGVQWDVTGCSYYPFWSGLTAEQARDQIDSWYAAYQKPVLIMETGYDWNTNTCGGVPGQLANNGPETFPSTPPGQKEFLLNWFNAVKMVSGGHCLGDLYWDPIFICVPGEGWEQGQSNVVGNSTVFDFTGHVLPSLDAFYYNN